VVANAQEAGRKYINVASQLLHGGVEPNRAGPTGAQGTKAPGNAGAARPSAGAAKK
jgi:hypothetical protein